MQYRAFRNSDPPGLAQIWNSQPALRGRVAGMTAEVLELLVLAKPYFDREGLIVAERDGRLAGYVHAGFQPRRDGARLDRAVGVICQLMVAGGGNEATLRSELLGRAEEYLATRGATRIWAGGSRGPGPFYLGLYGGSAYGGLLEEDVEQRAGFETAGYQASDGATLRQRRLKTYRPPMNRQMLQLRRKFNVEARLDPASETWWEACAYVCHDRTRFLLSGRRVEQQRAGVATFWDLEPLASSWGMQAASLASLQLDAGAAGVAWEDATLFLLAEAIKQFHTQGVGLVEAACEPNQSALLGVLEELGFQPGGATLRYSKKLAS